MLALGILASLSVLVSGLPWIVSVPVAVIAAGQGVRLARRELLQPTRSLVIPITRTAATIDGEAMDDLQVRWRGPLAFLQWRDAGGDRQRLLGWPDNLAAAGRRELRLAMAARVPAQSPRSMAP